MTSPLPSTVVIECPKCGSGNPMFLKTRRIWKCRECYKQFSAKVGTVLEDSPIALEKWMPALWLLCNCKNGISSYELGRALGVTQKTAWFMLSRLRLALQDSSFGGGKLGGDEIPVHRHQPQRRQNSPDDIHEEAPMTKYQIPNKSQFYQLIKSQTTDAAWSL